MALNDAAADAALEVYITASLPNATTDQKDAVRGSLRPLYRSIFAGIAANAVVSPAGSPTAMNVMGGQVSGTGRLT